MDGKNLRPSLRLCTQVSFLTVTLSLFLRDQGTYSSISVPDSFPELRSLSVFQRAVLCFPFADLTAEWWRSSLSPPSPTSKACRIATCWGMTPRTVPSSSCTSSAPCPFARWVATRTATVDRRVPHGAAGPAAGRVRGGTVPSGRGPWEAAPSGRVGCPLLPPACRSEVSAVLLEAPPLT